MRQKSTELKQGIENSINNLPKEKGRREGGRKNWRETRVEGGGRVKKEKDRKIEKVYRLKRKKKKIYFPDNILHYVKVSKML